MELILTRSPYSVQRGFFDAGALLQIEIGYIYNYSFYLSKTYTLNFRNQKSLDISPLLRDYITVGDGVLGNECLFVKSYVSGEINGVTGTPVIETYTAVDGYGYYEDGFNNKLLEDLSNSSYYAGSNDTIYRHKDEPLSIPILKPDALNTDRTYVSYYFNDILLSTVYAAEVGGGGGYGDDLNTNRRVSYVTEQLFSSFQERVAFSGGSYEHSDCIDGFEDEIVGYKANKALISTAYLGSDNEERAKLKNKVLTIVPVEECKYQPHRLIFLNKFGVKEDLWFFKKSTESLEITKENYRANTFQSYSSGDLSQHVYRDYNVNGRESMTLNTGFVPESFSENFRQLMLSEKVWIDSNNPHFVSNSLGTGALLPVNIKDSSLDLKKSVNEKLINYTIEIDFSYDKINNVF